MGSKTTIAWALLWGALTLGAPSLLAAEEPQVLGTGEPEVLAAVEPEQFRHGRTLSLRDGESRTGDLYFAGGNVDLAGQQHGDLILVAQSVVISGEVDGDVAMLGQSLEISGRVLDSVRFCGSGLNVTGTIEGDVLFMGSQINIHPRAHITGNLIVVAGSGIVDGKVDGRLKFTGGKVAIGGEIGQNADLQADAIEIDPDARVHGDLTYTARKELETDLRPVVLGHIQYQEKQDEAEEEQEPWLTVGSVLWGIWRILSALLVGWVALAVFPRVGAALGQPLGSEALLVTLIGLGIFLVVPAACGLAILLVISLPLGLLMLLLFLAALYLAKMPVALWIGSRALRLLGLATPSPFLALALGISVLYLLFSIPYTVGFLLWCVATWLGLGSFVMAARTHLQRRAART